MKLNHTTQALVDGFRIAQEALAQAAPGSAAAWPFPPRLLDYPSLAPSVKRAPAPPAPPLPDLPPALF